MLEENGFHLGNQTHFLAHTHTHTFFSFSDISYFLTIQFHIVLWLWMYKMTTDSVYIIAYSAVWNPLCCTFWTEELEALVQVLWLVRFHLSTNMTSHRCSRSLHVSKGYLLQCVSTCPYCTHAITRKQQSTFEFPTDYISENEDMACWNGHGTDQNQLRMLSFTCVTIFINHLTWNTAETLHLCLCNLISHYKYCT